ncbi:flocculation-associated PEP-CTERM protein PepA [Inhella sp.]|uniref:flocculation-associated PEP-CTERM protein PepA n=1 Tax=Inhella sp. TaxID=1921806 RepID=UPI001AC86A2D|nr:flocculation-associated PEP-CTERM protein PepA [Burkholderiales bacterium]
MFNLDIAKKFGVAAVLTGAVAAASAGPTFTINRNHLTGLAQSSVVGDSFGTSGATRAVLSNAYGSGAGTVAGNGWISFDTVKLNGVTVGGSGIGGTWAMWAEFSFNMTLIAGGLGAPGSDYAINSVSMTLYGEGLLDASNAVFNAGDTATNPSVTVPTDRVTLGTGVFNFGAAGINVGGGSSFNPTMYFTLANPDGPQVFTAPVPFFPLAFASLTNDIGGISGQGTQNLHLLTGGTASFQLPEPTALALVGLALVGAGVASRRQLRK